MKLFRFGAHEQEKPGVISFDDTRLDVSAFGEDYDEKFFATDGTTRLAEWLQHNSTFCPEVPAETRLGACVARPSKIVCIGLNYAKHAAESGAQPPAEPVVFFKATSALCGPNDQVIIPRNSVKTDWEVELAVVIGKRTSYVEESEAMDYVAGYALHNDYSERAFQLEMGGQWVKGKSNDTFAPLGPYLVTADEIPEPHNLRLWLSLNGEMVQDSNTSDMIFYIPKIISYLSQFMTLLPGDVISTGTPSGVGLGMKPPKYLQPNDVVELGIEGLGTQKQEAIAWKAL
ncbi:fumarylacetoacetate hydrolase family protein [Persicitalea jodogahamensis]|uniref:2-hydroxyhepta-2,4-diene-1,7-dioate isomerase n=1 Tax=Persicitalea jodogahamensis TaxID=402147 RepID=A0A8J3D4C7_9BACT|nr:fumarylacetoacetate hydrolase family protein [Persicitalea jodogahamensis]GHB71835.1 2-hydroxyhepta-2,4-diene-1,7-dioate isomerase [Persicitalea jodogahamensis]